MITSLYNNEAARKAMQDAFYRQKQGADDWYVQLHPDQFMDQLRKNQHLVHR